MWLAGLSRELDRPIESPTCLSAAPSLVAEVTHRPILCQVLSSDYSRWAKTALPWRGGGWTRV